MPARTTTQKHPHPPDEPAANKDANTSVLLYEAYPNLSGVPDIFASMSPDEVRRVVAAGSRVDFKIADYLFRQGEPHEGIFILRAGAVRSYYVSPAGREITLANWAPGNFVGGPEIFGGGVHVWSGIAVQSGHAILLPGSATPAKTGGPSRGSRAVFHSRSSIRSINHLPPLCGQHIPQTSNKLPRSQPPGRWVWCSCQSR